MQIYGPSNVHGPHQLQGPHWQRPAARTAESAPVDQVDISPAAEAAAQASETGDVRADLVARVRGEIAAGTYETAEKLDAALERVLDQLG
jgi:negative regulator of flagellin synthesis FlgM